MTRVYNFSPGPCTLPAPVMQQAQQSFCQYGDLGASIMEVSHRGEAFLRVHRETEELLRQLMNIPDDYWVLFLSGGGRGQAAAIPLNMLGERRRAAYAISGHWSQLAAEEARQYGDVQIVADSGESGYTTLPTTWTPPDDVAYLHFAANETIHGVEFPEPPHAVIGNAADTPPLVADMSSNILSRPLRVSDYALIYASAQKNLAPAGVTVVIVRGALVQPHPQTPSILNYQKQQAKNSMYNTPPTFQIYMLGLMLKWVQEQGGTEAMAARNAEKSTLLYDYLDTSSFYRTPVNKDCRSRMNVPFFLPTTELTERFLSEAEQQGLIGLKGHTLTGGCRASIYNAMPLAGVVALGDLLDDFAARHAR